MFGTPLPSASFGSPTPTTNATNGAAIGANTLSFGAGAFQPGATGLFPPSFAAGPGGTVGNVANQNQGNLFGTQNQGNLFGTQNQGNSFGTRNQGNLFGSSANADKSSMFGAVQASPSFLTAGAAGLTNNLGGFIGLNPLSFQVPATTTQLPPEVATALSRVSNADNRSAQILSSVFSRLKSLITEKPTLVVFCYQCPPESDIPGLLGNTAAAAEVAAARHLELLEQQVRALNNAAVTTAFNTAKAKLPSNNRFILVPVEGFDGVEKRVELQGENIAKLEKALEVFRVRQSASRTHLENVAGKRLRDLTARQAKLQTDIIQAIGLVEEYALKNGLAQVDTQFLPDCGRIKQRMKSAAYIYDHLQRRVEDDLATLESQMMSSMASDANLVALRRALIDLREKNTKEMLAIQRKPSSEEEAYAQSALALAKKIQTVSSQLMQRASESNIPYS